MSDNRSMSTARHAINEGVRLLRTSCSRRQRPSEYAAIHREMSAYQPIAAQQRTSPEKCQKATSPD
jgi:hypothetical protein